MKPESIKSILHFYLQEKSCSDDIDGSFDFCDFGIMSGEAIAQCGGGFNDLYHMEADVPSSFHQYEEHYEPLDPEREAIAQGIGRQLRQLSIEFDSDHAEAIRNQLPTIGTKSIQFKERFVHVSPSCGSIKIPVILTGSSDEMAQIAWRTYDKTAKSDIHYIGSQGNINFTKGDVEKIIEIKIRNQEETDVCFAVELYHPQDTNIGHSNPVTVYIVDHSKLYDDEKQVVRNIFSSNNISISNVLACMRDKVTNNTFKAALQRLCSTADTIPQELYLGSELLRLTLPHARFSTLNNVLCDFFSYLPEMEDITELFG
ncbi:calx-beta domain-containing protein [Nephila pilipes]|uniref:Calx-beta domain-containing protein n=1 Tax=Nephila pilipes TaxID=299642 RepID=A0A8X6T5L4_NEPPI|nr:calx-beta domain-containing protein [Nephila pilipes]